MKLTQLTQILRVLTTFPDRANYQTKALYVKAVRDWLMQEQEYNGDLIAFSKQLKMLIDEINAILPEIENASSSAQVVLENAQQVLENTNTVTQKTEEATQKAQEASQSATTAAQSATQAAQSASIAEATAQAVGNNLISDISPTTATTYSSTKIEQLIADIVSSAPEHLNTLKELADALSADDNAINAINSTLSQKLGKSEKAKDSDKLDGLDSSQFSRSNHNHDSRYYTESESNGRYAYKNATNSSQGGLKVRLAGTTLYTTSNGSNA